LELDFVALGEVVAVAVELEGDEAGLGGFEGVDAAGRLDLLNELAHPDLRQEVAGIQPFTVTVLQAMLQAERKTGVLKLLFQFFEPLLGGVSGCSHYREPLGGGMLSCLQIARARG
jgi:hypothetical protein